MKRADEEERGFDCHEDHGWCGGTLIETVPKRNRKIDGVQVNFRAKFDVDEFPCDLALEAKD